MAIEQFHPFEDERGYYMPLFKLGDFQLNESFSKARVFRGLHIQSPAQKKMVRCVSGHIIDIWVDLKGMAGAVELFGGNQFVEIEPGYLHGFIAVEDSLVQYLSEGAWNPSTEKSVPLTSPSINWCDVDEGLRDIIFNLHKSCIMSPKDRAAEGAIYA